VAEFTGGTPPLRLIYSKDRTQVFITNNGASLLQGDGVSSLQITFTPWEYDGKSYGQAQTLGTDLQGKITEQDVPAVTVTVPIEWE
jgi:hypothetical protein